MSAATATPAEAAPLFTRTRARLIARWGIYMADLARYWPMAALLAAITLLTVFVPRWFPATDNYGLSIRSFHGMVGIIAFSLGLAMAGEDFDRRTIWLIMQQPARPLRILLGHLLAALVLVVLFVVLCEAGVWINNAWLQRGHPSLLLTLGHYDLPSMWQFGTSWPLAIVQIITLILTGIAGGSLFRNYITGAIVGLTLYVLWYVTWMLLFRNIEARGGQVIFHGIMIIQQALLSGLMTTVYLRQIHWQESALTHLWPRSQSRARAATQPGRRRSLRGRTWLRRVVNTTALSTGAIIIAALVIEALHLRGQSNQSLFILVVICNFNLIGSSAFVRQELNQRECLLYWQPVTRSHIFWPRILGVTVAALLPVTIIAPWISYERTIILYAFTIALASCYTGLFFRLLYRNALFAAIIGAGLLGSLAMPLGSLIINTNTALSQATFNYMLHALVVMSLVPLTCAWLTYCHTNLLQLDGWQRAGAVASATFSFIALLLLAMFTSFQQTIWLLLNAIFH